MWNFERHQCCKHPKTNLVWQDDFVFLQLLFHAHHCSIMFREILHLINTYLLFISGQPFVLHLKLIDDSSLQKLTTPKNVRRIECNIHHCFNAAIGCTNKNVCNKSAGAKSLRKTHALIKKILAGLLQKPEFIAHIKCDGWCPVA